MATTKKPTEATEATETAEQVQAFTVAGKKEATKAEAEELVKKFANKEVEN